MKKRKNNENTEEKSTYLKEIKKIILSDDHSTWKSA